MWPIGSEWMGGNAVIGWNTFLFRKNKIRSMVVGPSPSDGLRASCWDHLLALMLLESQVTFCNPQTFLLELHSKTALHYSPKQLSRWRYKTCVTLRHKKQQKKKLILYNPSIQKLKDPPTLLSLTVASKLRTLTCTLSYVGAQAPL